MSTFSPAQWAKAKALLAGVFYVPCFFWGYFLTDPVLRELHVAIFRTLTFGYGTGMDLTTFVMGLVVFVVLGALCGWLLATFLNWFRE